MGDELRSVLSGTLGLDVALAVAVWLTFTRPVVHADAEAHRRVASIVRFAIASQVEPPARGCERVS